MIFSHQKEFSDRETKLIRELFEKLIGKDEETCQEIVQDNDFIFLDQWDKKMGFVKEEKDQYLILSLYFEEAECNFYQVIMKGRGEKWLDSRIFDSNLVREMGIISEEL